MRRHIIYSYLLLALLVGVLPAAAQVVVPQGVVPLTGANSSTDVTTLPSGDFVVVWSVPYTALYGAKLTPAGGRTDFTIATYTSGGFYGPRVDSDDSGNFWVVWQEGFSSNKAAKFDQTTAQTVAPFAVGGMSSYNPDVGVAKTTGSVVVGYQKYFSSYAQGFNTLGNPTFGSTYTTYASSSKLGVDSAGNFMVVWSGDYLTASSFDPSGNSLGADIPIVSPPYNFDVAGLGSGQFVVVWGANTYYPSYTDYIKAQVMSTTAPVGSPIDIATGVPANFAVSGNGSTFVVVWSEANYYGAKGARSARRSHARMPSATGDVSAGVWTTGGTAVGSPVLMNSGYPAYGGSPPGVSMNSSGQFTVVWGNYSTMYSQAAFVCPNPVAPILSAPVLGATVNSPVTFTWGAAAGAVSYDLYAAVGGSPGLIASGIAGTSYSGVVLPQGLGSWYVVANFGVGCPTAQSNTETFQVCPVATAPTLSAPIGGAVVTSPVTFSWGAVTGAASYDVYVGVGGTPTLQGNTTGTTFGPLALGGGAGTWYVVANFGAGCPTAQSATGSFNICPALTAPMLVSPAASATVTSPVTFQWGSVAGATSYELFVGIGTTPSLAGTTANTFLSVTLPDGVGDWYVVAKAGASCPTATSPTRIVNVQSPVVCPPTSTPTLSAPANGAEFVNGELVTFEWTAAPNATGYEVWTKLNGGLPALFGTTTSTSLTHVVSEGTLEWYVITTFGTSCPTTTTASRTITVTPSEPPPACGLEDPPIASIVGEATTGEVYVLRWEALQGADKYHVQESSNAAFTNIISEQTVGTVLQATFNHPNLTQATPFFYRVAGIIVCDDGEKQGPYSGVVRVVGLPKPTPSSTNPQVVTEFGNNEPVVTTLAIPGFGTSGKTTSVATFAVNSNEPWLTVSPASGVLPPEGTTVTLSADPEALGVGANTATVTVTRDDGLGKSTSGGSTTSVPVAVSLVTPVSPVPKGAGPPENALIIPAVANVTGLTSKWFSDVKVTNRSSQVINYELNFSATDKSGTIEGKQTKVTIRPGQTVALDDVVRQWYGLGDLADGTNGALEIRPINFNGKVGPEAAPMLATVASSRTYTRADNSLASYGQFIPAVPFSSFLKAGVQDALLMMQQVSQTDSLRTNFGIVEGAGKNVNVLLTAYDRQGAKLGEFPVALKAGEHKQLNSLLALNGITVQDGRMSVQIVSGEGAVTSYASVVAAGTGDPSLVPGINPASLSAKRYVLPGVADLRVGAANWRSDVRIFNPNTLPESVNVFFYPQGQTTPLGPVEIQIQPGEIKVLEGVVETLFNRQDLGGALHVVPISGEATSLVITGETYDVSELGKYGQFISAVTEANAIGVGSPGLEVMQVEQSAQFRTNLGLAEVTGQSATVQIQLTVPNSLIAPTRQITLGGNEFQQLNGIVSSMTGGRDVYNGRLTVRVIGGTGKITAYGSTVDNQTRDATFSAGQ